MVYTRFINTVILSFVWQSKFSELYGQYNDKLSRLTRRIIYYVHLKPSSSILSVLDRLIKSTP